MIAAAILAAGRSSRMGRSKALLPHPAESTTFLGHIVTEARLAGLMPIVVVGRADDDELRDEVARFGAELVVNPEPDRGQLSSLIAALDALEVRRVEGVVVLPVDVPLVSAAVIRKLIEARTRASATVIRAVYRGRHGHPVLFSHAIFDELKRADPELGARSVVRADPGRVLDIEAGDAGVVFDIDTPEDYQRLMREAPDDPISR